MKINIDSINYIAKLAKLKFTKAEAMNFADEFESIFNHFQNVDKEDLTGIDLYDYENHQGVLRKDQVESFVNQKELYKNIKQKQGDYISIPKVME